jgi:hypothetical protein
MSEKLPFYMMLLENIEPSETNLQLVETIRRPALNACTSEDDELKLAEAIAKVRGFSTDHELSILAICKMEIKYGAKNVTT